MQRGHSFCRQSGQQRRSGKVQIFCSDSPHSLCCRCSTTNTSLHHVSHLLTLQKVARFANLTDTVAEDQADVLTPEQQLLEQFAVIPETCLMAETLTLVITSGRR